MHLVNERKRVFGLREQDEQLLPDVIKIAHRHPVAGPSGVVITDEGLVVVDTGMPQEGAERVKAIRTFTDKPFHTIIYSHGHRDHSGGVWAFLEDAEKRGHTKPRIIAHANVKKRFDKYRVLKGRRNYSAALQFPDDQRKAGVEIGQRAQFPTLIYPDTTFLDFIEFKLGGLTFQIYHNPAETDDTIWVWVPERKLAMIGDLIIGSAPNTGNPLKEQRYTLEWAEALEAILEKQPEIIIAGPGALQGEAGRMVLAADAQFLRYIHDEVVRLLNKEYWIEDILEKIKLPAEMQENPWLVGSYGHPTFVIHDVYRRYTGWYGGNPTDLFPLKSKLVNAELLKFIEPGKLIEHARSLQKENDTQMALHIIDFVVKGTENEGLLKESRLLKAELLEARAGEVDNFIARNIMRTSAGELRQIDAEK